MVKTLLMPRNEQCNHLDVGRAFFTQCNFKFIDSVCDLDVVDQESFHVYLFSNLSMGYILVVLSIGQHWA